VVSISTCVPWILRSNSLWRSSLSTISSSLLPPSSFECHPSSVG
jgi:hypothetical protein